MTNSGKLMSDYVKVTVGGWTGWIHRRYQSSTLLSVFCGDSLKPDPQMQKVSSSDMARVYRRSVETDQGPVTLYVKEYLPRTAFDRLKGIFRLSRAMRSFKAGLMLQSGGLDTPVPAAVLERRGGRNVLITEEMNNARPLYGFFETELKPGSRHRGSLIRELAQTVGRMHARGILHGDLRGGNIFISSGEDGRRFYLIDNERTMQYRRLSNRQRVKNLVQLNMLRYDISNTERLRFLKVYGAAAGLNRTQWRQLAKTVHRKTDRRIKHRAQTRMRISDAAQQNHWAYKRARLGRLRGIFLSDFCEGTAAHHFLSGLETLMQQHVLKDDLAARVVRCTYNGREIVIKRYNYQGLWHSIRHTLKGSRAQKNWRFGHRLTDANIPCAPLLGMVEERVLGLVRQSYIINAYVEGPLLYDVMNKPGYSPQERQAVMEKAMHLLHDLGRHRLTHNDMKPANMIIHKGQPVLIDLDSMQQHRISFYFNYRHGKMVEYFQKRLHGKVKR